MLLEEFKKIVPETEHGNLLQWWRSLDIALQDELNAFHLQGDAVANVVTNINNELFAREKRSVTAREVDGFHEHDFPNQDYYENLVGNEMYLCLRGPTFHICKAHADLRLMLLLGILPKRFTCYIGNRDCAMAKNLHADDSGYWSLTPAQQHTLKT